jgi:hypothetical protein
MNDSNRREDPMLTIRIPRSSWNQIVDDICNMCGTGDLSEIEILSDFEIVGDPE